MRASIAVLAFLALTVRAKGDWGRSSADRTSRTAGDCRPERRDGDGCWRCAVLDASRLARNGRDWHHLLELCGLVGARVIDLDGVYDPCRPNDRLLLGMKGSISEFELGVLRARMYDAARSKARRGELRIGVPVGYVWDPRDWPRPRPRHAAPGGGPSHLREVPRAGQRAASSLVPGGGPAAFSSTVRRQANDRLRLDADPLSQRHIDPQEPLLRRRL